MLCGGASAVTVEQTQVCMPQIDVYMYEDDNDLAGVDKADITATLNGEPLNVRDFGKSEQGIFYVYMLDVSASIPAAHFAAAKQAVLDAWTRLRDQDSLALITFGNDVTLRLEGGESRSKVSETLDSLQNTDKNTKFFNAMDALIELVLKTEDMRRVAVVISDGIDDTDAGMTQEELENKLVRTGVSVSAMCIDTVSQAAMNQFGDFIRLSGGELYAFGPDSADSVLDTMLDRLDGGWHLELDAPTNIASGKEEPLSIDFGGGKTVDIPITPERWTPDDTPPRVDSVRYESDSNSFVVTFSEPVSGGDDAGAYALTDETGASVGIARIVAEDGKTCRLMLSDPLREDATLTLTVSGLRDVSMEQNEMVGYSETVRSGAAAPEQTGEAAGEMPVGPLVETSTLIIIGAAALLVVAAIVTIIVLSSKKAGGKKDKERKNQKDKPDSVKSTATFMFLNKDEKKDGKK